MTNSNRILRIRSSSNEFRNCTYLKLTTTDETIFQKITQSFRKGESLFACIWIGNFQCSLHIIIKRTWHEYTVSNTPLNLHSTLNNLYLFFILKNLFKSLPHHSTEVILYAKLNQYLKQILLVWGLRNFNTGYFAVHIFVQNSNNY